MNIHRFAFVSVVMIVIAAVMVAKTNWPNTEVSAFAPPPVGPPVFQMDNGITLQTVTIAAPVAGSNVFVTVAENVFTNVNEDTELSARNATTQGPWSNASDWVLGSSVQVKTPAGLGDSIEVRAVNPSGQGETIAYVGIAPASVVDQAPPTHAGIGDSLGGGSLTLSGGSIKDQNFPVQLVLENGGASGSQTIQGSNGTSTTAISISVAASSGDVVKLIATDHYGNRNTIYYKAGASATSAAVVAFPAAPSKQSPAERTGMVGYIQVADSALVPAHNVDDLIVNQGLEQLSGPSMKFSIALTYRAKSIHPDSVFGESWDSTLNQRVKKGMGGYYHYNGDGSRHGPFVYSHVDSGSGHNFYTSPTGEFRRLSFSKLATQYYLTSSAGIIHTFDSKSGLLISIENYYGSLDDVNKIYFHRDSDGRVLLIQSNGGRQLLRFGYWNHGRLASIMANDGATTLLNYDHSSNGKLLSSVVQSDGTKIEYLYNSTIGRMQIIRKHINGSSTIDLLNGIENSSLGGWDFRNQHNASAGNAMRIVETVTDEQTKVTDAAGAETVYQYQNTSTGNIPGGIVYVEQRSNLNKRAGHAYLTDDPYAWRRNVSLGSNNYLAINIHHEKSSSITAWVTPVNLEETTYTYQLPTGGGYHEPWLYSRSLTRNLLNDLGQVEFSEVWHYPSNTAKWIDNHDSLSGVSTTYQWNAAGQLLTSKVSGITTSRGTTYDIETKNTYDTLGKLESTQGANRRAFIAGGGADNPESQMTYYSSGSQYGYLKKRQQVAEDLTNGVWSEHKYDSRGRITLLTQPGYGSQPNRETEYFYDSLGRIIKQIGSAHKLTGPGANSNSIRIETNFDYVDGRLDEVTKSNFTARGFTATPALIVTQDLEYDSAGRIKVSRSQLTSSEYSRVEYDYDTLGQEVASRSFTVSTRPSHIKIF